MRSHILGIFLIVLTSFSFSQEFRLPPSLMGRAVKAYLDAFNSGDTSRMKACYDEFMAPGRSTSERLSMYQRMKGQVGSLRPIRLLRSDEERIVLIARSELEGALRLSFMFSGGDAPKILGLGIDQADEDEQPIERAASIEEFVRKLAEEIDRRVQADQFSGVVLVLKEDEPIFERAYGLADRERRVPNTVDTRFNLGSINKAFTSLAIRRLAAEGRLAYDDVVGTYLPDYPNEEVRSKVTIQQLLTMRSGIGDFFGDRFNATPKEKLRTISDYLPLFADEPLLFEPGTSSRYSNGGYLLLGRLIEVITGEDYYEHIRRTIFEPAGMSRTQWYERDNDASDIARGYTRDDDAGTWVRNLATLPQRGSSAGGGYSTAYDLVAFVHALESGLLGTPDYEFAGGMGIAGGAPGINAGLEWMPADDVIVVVLTNLDPPSATSVSRLIRDMLP